LAQHRLPVLRRRAPAGDFFLATCRDFLMVMDILWLQSLSPEADDRPGTPAAGTW